MSPKAEAEEPWLKYSGLNNPDLIEDTRPSPLLYHYTNAKGFIGIVESKGCLRATHHRYLNDRGEISFGLKAASHVLRGFRHELPPEVIEITEGSFKHFLDEDWFISCLSARYDSLSQWRAYANNCAGYCIGLRPAKRVTNFVGPGGGEADDFWSMRLLDCSYGDDDIQAELTRRFDQRIRPFIVHNAPMHRDDVISELASQLSSAAWQVAPVAKHEHFKEEEESRLVVAMPPDYVKFHEGTHGLTPYLETDRLAIESVWVGPAVGPTPEIAARTARKFLERNGVNALVSVWDSPYRR